MPDMLSPIERQLIEAALAAGRVTQVPRGVSGMPIEGVSWRDRGPEKMRMVKRAERLAKAKAQEEAPLPEAGQPAQRAKAAPRVKPARVIEPRVDKRILAAQARLAAARAFAEKTPTVKEMAKHLGMSEDYTLRYCRKNDIALQLKLRSAERVAATAQRDAQIREMASAGRSCREIADALGASRFAIYARAAAIKVKLQGRSVRPKAVKPKQEDRRAAEIERRRALVEARRVQVRALAGEGLTAAQISKQLNVSVSMIWLDAREMGIKTHHGQRYVKGPTAETSARWDRVKELAAKGLFAREIAAQLGMRPALVRADAKRAGIALAKEQGSWAAKGTQASQLGRTKKVTARREMLKRVFRPDLTRQQILEALKAEGFDVKIGSLEADMIALDLKVNRKGKSTAPDRIEMARGEILSLREMGLSPITVARRVGLSVGRVMQVLSEEGRHAA
jgi:DNA-binding CsgD family transcriptional regulator